MLKSSSSISNEKHTSVRHLKLGENKVPWNKNAIIEKGSLTDHNQRSYFLEEKYRQKEERPQMEWVKKTMLNKHH